LELCPRINKNGKIWYGLEQKIVSLAEAADRKISG
jgi:hypothetical protein